MSDFDVWKIKSTGVVRSMAASQYIKHLSAIASVALLAAGLAACGGGSTDSAGGAGSTGDAASNLSGSVSIDGSSTVFPITEAMAEEFQIANPDVKVTVGVSGTGGGFKKFCGGETDISNASRPVKEKEVKLCEEAGIEFIEVPVAYDALSVVVNKDNDWAACLTTDELKKMWEPEAKGKIKSWKQIRDSFPDEPLVLYAPGTDSGTFDYFTEAINGDGGVTREDFTPSEDDNVLVTGVQGTKGALAYFGFAYYEENKDGINVVTIDNSADEGENCIEPSLETVKSGTYVPLARPIFIYVKKASLDKPEVKAFVDFYMNSENKSYVSETGYIPLTDGLYTNITSRIASKTTGTVFSEGSVGVDLNEVFTQ